MIKGDRKYFYKEYRQDKKAIAHVEVLLANKDFMTDIKRMRKEWVAFEKDDNGGFYYNSSHNYISTDTVDSFLRQIRNILKKYKLSRLYERPVISLIIKGRPAERVLGFDRRKKPYLVRTIDKQRVLLVPIHKETTIKDIQEQWPEIKEVKEKFYRIQKKKIVIPKNSARDLYILNLRETGKSDKEIARSTNKKYPKTLIGPADVHKIIKRLRDRAR